MLEYPSEAGHELFTGKGVDFVNRHGHTNRAGDSIAAYLSLGKFRRALASPSILDCPEDTLRRCRAVQGDNAPAAEGANGLPQSFADRNCQHEWRFPYGFAAEENSWFGGTLQKFNVEFLRHFRPRRQFVCRSAVCHQPAIRVPNEFFQGEPAHALDKAAFHLTAIDIGGKRFTYVMQDVGPQ